MTATHPSHRKQLIAAHDLCVAEGNRVILDHVSLCVDAGEIVTVVGPNGAGKTTLVKAMLGLITPASGEVETLEGLRIGYVPQRMPIDPILPLTVRRLMTLTQRASDPEIMAALEETSVAHLIDQQVHGLSGGEFQRVLLARALLRRPQLLVLDEPVQGVDFTGEIALYDLIGDIRTRYGCGVLMISHDLHIVMAATDRVICLHGHVCCEGEPKSIGRHPEYRRLFGAEAAAKVALYPHAHDHEHAPDGAIVHGHTHHEHTHHEHAPQGNAAGCIHPNGRHGQTGHKGGNR